MALIANVNPGLGQDIPEAYIKIKEASFDLVSKVWRVELDYYLSKTARDLEFFQEYLRELIVIPEKFSPSDLVTISNEVFSHVVRPIHSHVFHFSQEELNTPSIEGLYEFIKERADVFLELGGLNRREPEDMLKEPVGRIEEMVEDDKESREDRAQRLKELYLPGINFERE